MSYDPLKRDSTWQKLQPGCYLDPEGYGHLFPDEVLAFLSVTHPEAGFDPNSKDDYDTVVEVFSNLLRELAPNVKAIVVVKHEREEN